MNDHPIRGTRRGLSILAMALALTATGCASTAPTSAPTPSPTEIPPTATPPPPAAGCTGSDTDKEFFVQAATVLHFDVYCAVLPSDWSIQKTNLMESDGGQMSVLYASDAGDEIAIAEGRLCDDDALSACADQFPDLGPASFGDLAGTMREAEEGFCVLVSPHSMPAYALCGHDTVSQARVGQYAAAVIKVPRPGS